MTRTTATEEEGGAAADAESLQQTLLNVLAARGSLQTLDMAAELKVDHQKLIGALKSLEATSNLVESDVEMLTSLKLTAEGEDILSNGSYEYRIFQSLGEQGAPHAEIEKLSYGKFGVGKAMQNGWIRIEKGPDGNKCVRKVESVEDAVQKQLQAIFDGKFATLAKPIITDLKRRKMVEEITTRVFHARKGSNFTTKLAKEEHDLTAEMITSGSWRGQTFKKYNFNALGVPPPAGHLHPLLKVRSEFRDIFFQMGFSEMDTTRYVESSFWNFDALFQPQQHPARDSHDTFFISEPSLSTTFPMDYLKRVAEVHSSGGYGSVGYQYDWKQEEAQKNVLRTHTTAVTARYLYEAAQKEFKPLKMFSIDRVFRNETLDATHLAEFHQVEGVFAERNLSLAHVIGLFTEFFRKCGIGELMFKPTYNPYTEPSMEIYARHEGLNKWVEIGNSGIFRPEMLRPMGFPEDVSVAGFGLSLERPTMIRYGLCNIRELFGHKIDLEMIYKNPICRLDKKADGAETTTEEGKKGE